MRTNIVIDEKLMKETLRLTGLKTKREAVELGLRTIVRLRKQQEIRRFRGKLPWRGVVRRCYRGSVLASAAVTSMIAVNRRRQTWNDDVDAFIALSEHSRAQFIAGQLPADPLRREPPAPFARLRP